MVTQFVPAPIAWELKVKYELPAWVRGYDGWESQAFPVIGWAYLADDSLTVEAVVSYKGEAKGALDVLEALKAEAVGRATRQNLTGEIGVSYELAPA